MSRLDTTLSRSDMTICYSPVARSALLAVMKLTEGILQMRDGMPNRLRFIVVIGILFLFLGRGGASALESLESSGDVRLWVGAVSNNFEIRAAMIRHKVRYVAIYDKSGPVEVTLRDNQDCYIWSRGSSNSWTLYAAKCDKMAEINRGFTLNQYSFRWFLLLEQHLITSGLDIVENPNREAFRLVRSDRHKEISSAFRSETNSRVSYYDVNTLSDGTEITNFSGQMIVTEVPLVSKAHSSEVIEVGLTACSSSKIFTNVLGELSARLTNNITGSSDVFYPSLSTNYGTVIDYRTGMRIEYGLPELTDSSWPLVTKSGFSTRTRTPIMRWILLLLLIGPFGALVGWRVRRMKEYKKSHSRPTGM